MHSTVFSVLLTCSWVLALTCNGVDTASLQPLALAIGFDSKHMSAGLDVGMRSSLKRAQCSISITLCTSECIGTS